MLNHYDLGLYDDWFEIPRDFTDYRVYESSIMLKQLLWREFLIVDLL